MTDFTPEQLKVINCESGDLIVTASAGSGKTRVMTERFINLVLKNKTSADRILCVTFTKLAAEELKTRISKALRGAMLAADEKEALRLRSEIEKLPSAAISTVDSFCNTIVKKYFYVADVDPQFTIIDDKASAKLKKVAMDELFESLYENDDEALSTLLPTFIKGRSDRRLKDIVFKLSDFLSCEVDGEKYLEHSVAKYDEQGVKNAVNGLIDLFIKKLSALLSPIERLKEESERSGLTKYVEFLNKVADDVKYLEKEKSVESVCAFKSIKFVKPKQSTKDDPEKTFVSDKINEILSVIRDLSEKYYGFFTLTDQYARCERVGKVLSCLADYVKRFNAKYDEMKREISALDYSDLEHYAYKILCAPDVCEEIKNDYDYIFVDEYQDTNGIQEAIFSKLDDNDLFVVGDEKQSIYGFRGCDSTIFESRVENSPPDMVVNLDKNFRSTDSVIKAVNGLFSAVMTKSTAGKDYSAHPMIYGGLYDKTVGRVCIVRYAKAERSKSTLPEGVYSVKKHLLTLNDDSEGQEERAVRTIIDKVYGEKYVVTDRGGNDVEKKIGFNDIAVLTRTGTGAVDRIVKELTSCGIPVVSNSKRSIGEYPEIKMIVSVLDAVAYSGKEDFSLATALRSPVGGLTDSELLTIRNTFKDGSYFEAVNNYRLGRIDGISIKLNEFFDYIEKLKLLSQFEGVSGIVKRIVEDKNLDLHLLTERFGELKVKRLERFIGELESGDDEMSLTDFFVNKEAVLENMTISFADGDNAVRVMDMHQSKGLEFPVVILCELKRNFYAMDRREQFTASRKYGIGLKYYDVESKTVYPTVVKCYIDELSDANTLREEMRLFYVAMTRAMHSLYMLTDSPPAKRRLGFEADNAKCFADFLCLDECELIDLTESEDAAIEKTEERKVVFSDEPLTGQVKRIEKFIGYKYPFIDDVNLSVKRTVTEITRSAAEADQGERTYEPLFAAESIESGNAYHKFLQYSSLEKASVDDELTAYENSGLFTKEELSLLDADKLKSILDSELYRKISGYKLYREQPFIANVPAEMAGERGRAQVLIQGVIDLLAVKDGGAVIIDYKYSGRTEDALVSAYGKQLELYAYAVEKVLKYKIEAKYIFNIKTSEVIEL